MWLLGTLKIATLQRLKVAIMEIVYNGYDNEIRLKVSELVQGSLSPFDFTGATSVELVLPELNRTITNGIGFSEGNGVLTLALGDASIPTGRWKARIVVFDPLHADGQIVVHEEIHRLRLYVPE